MTEPCFLPTAAPFPAPVAGTPVSCGVAPHCSAAACARQAPSVHARLKTDAARREVILAPAMVRLLRERWLSSPFKGADDFVFATTTRRGLNYHHVGDVFREAVRRAGLKGQGRLSLHSLRHGYASLLIAKRLDVVFVSCQLGHANANVTLSVYAHLFAQREHGEVARQALEASYAAMMQTREVMR